MVHPLPVHVFQQHHPLNLPHDWRGEGLLPLLVQGLGPFHKEFFYKLRLQILCLPGGIFQIPLPGEPARVVGPQALQIPVVVGDVGGQIVAHIGSHSLLYHLENHRLHVVPIEDLVPLAIDNLPLVVHHLVVLQHVFPNAEVPALHLALGVLNRAADHARLNGHIVLNAQLIHHGREPLAAEQAHQIVLQGDVEPALARVPLAAGAAPQLVVNPPGLVALSADNIQAPQLLDLLGLGGNLLLILPVQPGKGLPGL